MYGYATLWKARMFEGLLSIGCIKSDEEEGEEEPEECSR